jgi:TP901-1 family phage major tail protein
MPTTGVFNGTELIVKVDDKVIGHTTSATFTVNADLPDATTKDSSGWAENIHGLRSWSISGDGLVDYSDDGTTTQGAVSLRDLIQGRTSVTLYWGTQTVGDVIYTGSAKVESIEESAEMESPVSYSFSFTGSGAITKATLT